MLIQDELRSWIKESAEAGKNFSQIVVRLAIDHGYSLLVAKRIVNLVLHSSSDTVCSIYRPAPAAPEVRTASQRTMLELAGAQPEISFETYFPRIVLLDNLLSSTECEELCRQGLDLLAPAEIINQGKLDKQGEIRSSFTARLPANYSDLVSLIEARIGQLVDWPVENSEPLQIQRYFPGQQYIPHFDFFEQPASELDKFASNGGQRLATLIIYLKQPEAGGATYFSNLGLRITPRVGSALFFSYPDASVAGGTMHSGEKVVSGEKWIITKWFRQKAVRSSDAGSFGDK